MSNESNLRVGILGAARIAKKNVAALRSVSSGCNFVAIASRSLEKAQAFVHDYVCNEGEENMIKIFGGDSAYAELIQSDCVSAVYVPLPVSVKKEWIIKALRNKKHVLCEKPVSINNGDYEDLLRIAKEENCFLKIHSSRCPSVASFHTRALILVPPISIVKNISPSPQFKFSKINYKWLGDSFGSHQRFNLFDFLWNVLGKINWPCRRYQNIIFNTDSNASVFFGHGFIVRSNI